MYRMILFFFLFNFGVLNAQDSSDCDQLAIEYHGIVDSEGMDQLFIEVSNELYTGTLYYYPSFVLVDEEGNIVAKDKTRYYGIGNNFQTHLLDIQSEITFPFFGELRLYVNKGEGEPSCVFPIEIDDADYVSLKEIQDEAIKIVTNMAEDHIILDMKGYNPEAEHLNYLISVTNEAEEEVYSVELQESITSIPLDKLRESGIYSISIWDEINEKMLPIQEIEIFD